MFTPPVVITHNTQFMEAGAPIVLRGVDVPGDNTPTIVDKLGNVNFVRIRIDWADIEPSQGTFDPAPLAKLDAEVQEYQADHVQMLLDFHITTANPMPAWAAANTGADWWTSASSLPDYEPFVNMMVNRYDGYSDVMGYELWNEPQGASSTAAGTEEVIRWESQLITDVRAIDKQRAIVVMLRGGWDLGLRHAKLHDFGDTHHLVLDFHDQFCGCLTGDQDGYSADGETTIRPSNQMTNNGIDDYQGTSADQAAHLAYVDRWVKTLKRPVIVGEFEAQATDPHGSVFQDQLTTLMAQKGYSWARWQGPGTWQLATGSGYGVLNDEGIDLAQILAR